LAEAVAVIAAEPTRVEPCLHAEDAEVVIGGELARLQPGLDAEVVVDGDPAGLQPVLTRSEPEL
jgi:hypothetical protein